MNLKLRRSEIKGNPTLRMNARNLRAKVRSMLPLDICCKYEQRNTLVCKLQNKKKQWENRNSYNTMKHWTNNKQNTQPQWFYEKFNKIQPKHMFSKLNAQQIEQICDHKHYFVGQRHFEIFDEFLNPKSKQKKKLRKQQLDNFGYKTSITNVDSDHISLQKSSKMFGNTYRSQCNFQKYLEDQNKRQIQVKLRYKNLQNQYKTNRQTKKIIISLKINKALQNVKLLSQKRNQNLMKKRQRMNEIKEKVIKKKIMQKQQIQISNLTTQLKKLCSNRE